MRGGQYGVAGFGLALTPMLILLGSCVAPSDAAENSAATDDVQASSVAPPAASTMPAAPAQPSVPTISIAPTQRLAQGALVRGSIWPANSTLTLNGAPVLVAPNGLFIIGFDRDAPASATLRMVPRTGAPVVRQLTIAPGQWAIQQINAPTRGAARSDAEFERRRPAELAQMGAARRIVVTSDGWRQRFIWPVRGRIWACSAHNACIRACPAAIIMAWMSPRPPAHRFSLRLMAWSFSLPLHPSRSKAIC